MIPLPNLSNQQSAQSANSVGSFTVISGGTDNLRTMLEMRRGTSETGGIPFEYNVNTGGIAAPKVGASFTLPGASAGFNVGLTPIIIAAIGAFLWVRYKK